MKSCLRSTYALESKRHMAKVQGVSAVIPSYNDKIKVFSLLSSLLQSDYKNLEIIVVVNGNAKKTITEGKKHFPMVKWVDAGAKNIGQTGCYNLGFAYAKKTNHILYIDSDVVVDKKMISNLLAAAERDPNIGIVTPMILYLSDKNWVNQAGANINLITGQVKVGWGPKKDFMKAGPVQNSGTVMLFTRKVVDKIGGVDDWFLCYFDPDYCLRARKVGFITWYEPKAVAFHDQSKDPKVWRPRVMSRAYLLGRNRVLFMRRHAPFLPSFIFFLPLMLGYYLIESFRFGQPLNFLKLLWGTLTGFFYPLGKSNYITLPKVHEK